MKNPDRKLVSFQPASEEIPFVDYTFIEYYIHGACKFNCEYCFAINNRMKNRDLEKQFYIVDTFYMMNQPFVISYFGGEPSEYKHVNELTNYIVSNNNGNLKRIEYQTNIDITMDNILFNIEKFGNIIQFAPSIHVSYLRRDNIESIVEKIDVMYKHDCFDKIAFMLERKNINKHYEIHSILKTKPYYNRVEYIHAYAEFEDQGMYTGKYNTTEIYSDMLADIEGSYIENFKLGYSDGTTEICNMNELFKRDVCFKDWICYAGKHSMYVEYTGDFWRCAPYHARTPRIGNIFEARNKFLLQTKFPHKCTLHKCDGCFWVKKSYA